MLMNQQWQWIIKYFRTGGAVEFYIPSHTLNVYVVRIESKLKHCKHCKLTTMKVHKYAFMHPQKAKPVWWWGWGWGARSAFEKEHSQCVILVSCAQTLKHMEGAIYLDSGLKTMFFKEKWYTTIVGRISFLNKQLKQPFINISCFKFVHVFIFSVKFSQLKVKLENCRKFINAMQNSRWLCWRDVHHDTLI